MEHRLPEVLVPVLKEVARELRKPGLPLDFWTIDHDATVVDGFQSLAELLMQSDIVEEDVPQGYVMLAHLFHWETECQFDGWGAFANVDEYEFQRTLEFFSDAGLQAEAHSLRMQMDAYRKDPEDIDALNQVVAQSRHPLSNDLDRLEYLAGYFRDNADALLYVRSGRDDVPAGRSNGLGA